MVNVSNFELQEENINHSKPLAPQNLGAIHVLVRLRNAVGGGRVSEFPEKSITKMYGSNVISIMRGWVGVEFPEEKPLCNT